MNDCGVIVFYVKIVAMGETVLTKVPLLCF